MYISYYINGTLYLTINACNGVLPRESASLISSLRPWSSSNLAVCRVSSADFLPSKNKTCSTVICCVAVRTVVCAPQATSSSTNLVSCNAACNFQWNEIICLCLILKKNKLINQMNRYFFFNDQNIQNICMNDIPDVMDSIHHSIG